MALHGKKPQTNQTIKIDHSCSEGRKYLRAAMFLCATKPSDTANGATGAPANATSLKKYLTLDGITILLISLNWTENF